MITGPFSTTISSGHFYERKDWYRQGKPPYHIPLPYEHLRRSYTHAGLGNDPADASSAYYDLTSSPCYVEAYNKAYSDFKEKLGEAASAAVNIAERKQAMDMFAKKTTQLFNALRALKSLNFVKAAEALGLHVVRQNRNSITFKRTNKSQNAVWERARLKAQRNPVLSDEFDGAFQGARKHRYKYNKKDDSFEVPITRSLKGFGDNYLAFHFGVEPMMKDIENTWKIFTDPMRDKKGLLVVGKGQAHAFGGSPSPIAPGSYSSAFEYASSVRIRARVKVANLALYRLEQLGLLNPAVLFLELVPFSFVADWFANVGDYLASFTDFIGMELLYPMSTHVFKHKEHVFYNANQNPYIGPGIKFIGQYNNYFLKRTVGISGPTLAFKPRKWPSVTRGLTAASLLAGFLRTV